MSSRSLWIASLADTEPWGKQCNTGSRAAVLSQAGELLSWTSERADTLFRLRAREEGSS